MEHRLSTKVGPLTDKDVEYFKYLTDTSEGWELSIETETSSVQSREFTGTNIRMFRMNAVFPNVLPSTVFDFIQDAEYRELLPSSSTSHTMFYLDDTNSIEYYCLKCYFPLQNRDLILQKTSIPALDDFIIIYHSVEDGLFVQNPGIARAFTFITGYRVRSTPEGALLTFLSHSDPKGYIPSFICNLVCRRYAPYMVTSMYEASQGYLDWKQDNNPYFMPWRFPEQRDQKMYPTPPQLANWGFLSN